MVETINGSDDWAQDSVQARRQLEEAEQFLKTGDFVAAQDTCRTLLAEHNEYVGALFNLGRAYLADSNYESALPCFFRASMLGPDNSSVFAGLAEVYCELQADDAALDAARDALDLDPDSETAAQAHLVLGRVLERASDYVRASEHLEQAIKLKPDSRTAALLLGACHMEQGNQDAAAKAYKTTLKGVISPLNRAQILYDLAQRPKSSEAKKLLSQIDKLKKETPALDTPMDEAFFRGGLDLARANILEGLGQHGDAWQALETGNAPLRQGFLKFSQALQQQTEPTIARAQGWSYAGVAGKPDGKDVPVTLLILGAAQSGKSTLERLVGSIAGVTLGFESALIHACTANVSSSAGLLSLQLPGQLPDMLHEEFSKAYVSELNQRASGAKLFTTTHPGLIPDLGRIAELVPNLRVAFIERNRDDSALRIFGKMYPQDSNPFAYEGASIDEHLEGYAQLIKAWSGHLGEISLRVNYEDMVANPKGTVAKIAKLCGLSAPKSWLPEIGDDRGCAQPFADDLNKARKQSAAAGVSANGRAKWS